VTGVRSGLSAALVLALEAADLLAGQLQLLGDGVLRHLLPAGVGNGFAEGEAGSFDERAGVFLRLLVRLARGYDICHRVRHPFMVSRVGLPP
jgi:hypothetical protein